MRAAQDGGSDAGIFVMTEQRGGAASAPQTIVFVHGSGDSAHAWDAVIERLPGYSCVALDLPGHGALVARPGPAEMSVADYADAVRAELARRELSGVCLVGHSLGSAIALHLAVDHPSLVRRLALVGSGARLRVLPALLDEARTDPDTIKRTLTSLAFAPGHEAQAEAYMRTLPPVAPGIVHRDLAACDRFDMMDELGRVAQPTLIIVGDADRLTPPKYAAFLRDRLANATLVTVPDAGHAVAVEAPDAVASALRDFLSSAG